MSSIARCRGRQAPRFPPFDTKVTSHRTGRMGSATRAGHGIRPDHIQCYAHHRPMWQVVAVVGVLLGILWISQRALIYFPLGDVPSPVSVGLPSAEPVTFETEDGLTLGAWFVSAVPPASGYTIVVFNGNA